MSDKFKLLDLLNQCTNKQQQMFKRMYSNDNLGRPLDEIIDIMIGSGANITLAILQAERTVKNNENRRDLKLKKIMRNYEN